MDKKTSKFQIALSFSVDVGLMMDEIRDDLLPRDIRKAVHDFFCVWCNGAIYLGVEPKISKSEIIQKAQELKSSIENQLEKDLYTERIGRGLDALRDGISSILRGLESLR